jgi:hypothetical protein
MVGAGEDTASPLGVGRILFQWGVAKNLARLWWHMPPAALNPRQNAKIRERRVWAIKQLIEWENSA